MSGGADFDAATAPPMVNGEVQFAEPWQGRVFGMARSLSEAGCFTWDEFRAQLIQTLRGVSNSGDAFEYYHYFQKALEALLAEKDLVLQDSLSARTEEFAARPHGHDHHHH